jgi:putative ABC transport system permease protein
MPRGFRFILQRLLPHRVHRDLFEPAFNDLRLDYIERAASRGLIARGALGASCALRILILLLDCWRLTPRYIAEHRSVRPTASEPSREHLSMLLFNLRHSFRMLRRERGFTAATVLTLALGIGANVAVFAVLEAVVLRPLPYPDADRLVILHHRDTRTGISKEFIAIGDFVDLLARVDALEHITAFGGGDATIYDGAEPFRAVALLATPNVFDLLQAKPALGRAFEPGDGKAGAPPVMILGYDLWESRFGSDPSVIGRSVRVGDKSRQVVGVAPRGFRFPPHNRAEIVLPLTMPAQAPAQRKNGWTFAVARIKSGVTHDEAAAQLASISARLEQEHPAQNQGSLYYPLSLRDALVGETKWPLLLMQGAVALVLLIACANVANLLIVRALARRQEMCVRMALGAGRGRLAVQLLTETLLLCLVGGALGVALAYWGVPALVALMPRRVLVPGLAEAGIDAGVLMFAVGVCVISALAFGVIAAFGLRRQAPAAGLSSAARAGVSRSTRRAASLVVAAEVGIAVVLLVAAGLVLRSFGALLSVNPGFQIDSVLTFEVQLPADRYREVAARHGFYDRAFDAIRQNPQVLAAGAAVVTPLTGNNWTVPFERADGRVPAGQRPPDVGWQSASGGYFDALRIPLRAGRVFQTTDRGDRPPVVIVSEAVERRFFPGESAVGKKARIGDGDAEIVGVVGDIRRAGLNDAPRADMYFPFEREPSPAITLFIRTNGDPLAALPAIQSTLKSLERQVVFADITTLDAVAAESIASTRLAFWLLGVFAALALTLAAIGVYGVMSYAVRQRTRELGTRLALGATKNGIAWMVMREGLTIVSIGLGVGVTAGLASTVALRSLLFGVPTSDPVTLAATVVVLGAAMVPACYLPARRAAMVDPARTLAE